MKIYAISGLGADERVFKYLTIHDHEIIPIKWLEPKKNESLKTYVVRLFQNIDTQQDFGILGVSFGGLAAVEINKIYQPKVTILVSSAETKKDLPASYRLIAKTRLLPLIPASFFDPPRVLAALLFDTKHHNLLNQILDDTSLTFAKWAIKELTSWKNTQRVSNPILKISGTKDRLLPYRKGQNTILVKDGGHFMIVDKATEISRIINDKLKEIS